MITINATGDTTLHTAGKYCPEDILVKVPSGGSSGGGSSNFYEETFTPTGNDIFTHNLGVVPTRFYITVDPSITANNTSLTRTVVSASGTTSTSCFAISTMPSGVTQIMANSDIYMINGSGSNITADATTLTYSGIQTVLNTTLIYKIFIFAD